MKRDIFKYKNEDYVFLSHYGLNAKIYGRDKKRILVENDKVILEYSDSQFQRIIIQSTCQPI